MAQKNVNDPWLRRKGKSDGVIVRFEAGNHPNPNPPILTHEKLRRGVYQVVNFMDEKPSVFFKQNEGGEEKKTIITPSVSSTEQKMPLKSNANALG